jgi:hypothetical protein
MVREEHGNKDLWSRRDVTLCAFCGGEDTPKFVVPPA